MEEPANNKKRVSFLDVIGVSAFRHLWIAQVCSQLSMSTVLFVLGLRLYQTTGSNTAVSGLFLAYGIPAVLFGIVAGTAVDRLDKRRVLLYCDMIRAVLVFSLFFVSGNLYIVYLVTFVNSLISQFYVPSEAPLIPKLVGERELVSANSLFSFTYYSSLAIGSIFAGPLLRLFGPQWIFIALAILFAAAAASVSRLPSMAEGMLAFRYVLSFTISRAFSRVLYRVKEGLSYVSRSRVLSDSLILLTGTQVIFMMLGTLGPGFADRVLAIDIRDASLLIVGPAVLGILVGSFWVGNFGSGLGKNTLIKAGITGAGISLLLLSLVVRTSGIAAFAAYLSHDIRLGASVVLFFLLGFFNSLLDVPANSLLQEEASGNMRGRVYGLLTAAIGGVGIIPVFLGGVLADTIGVGKVVFFVGLILLLFGIYRIKYNGKGTTV